MNEVLIKSLTFGPIYDAIAFKAVKNCKPDKFNFTWFNEFFNLIKASSEKYTNKH